MIIDKKNRFFLAPFLLAATIALGAQAAHAELLSSSNPITVVVAFPPGASADLLMRMISEKVEADTGQRILVKNMPGAGAAIAALAVKRAAPDGHTLLEILPGTHAISEITAKKKSYDIVKDFAPITMLWTFPILLVVPADSPAHTVGELIEWAKKKPGGLSFASQGINTSGQFLGEMLSEESGVPMVHVPYRGAAPGIVDLLAGRVDFFFVSYASVRPYIKSGKLRALAVADPERMQVLPKVPTIAEAGFPNVKYDYSQFGLAAPTGTPAATVEKLNKAYVHAAHDPAILKKAADEGVVITTNTPEQFARMIADEYVQLKQFMKARGGRK